LKKLKIAVIILIVLPVSIIVSHLYLNASSERMVTLLSGVEKNAYVNTAAADRELAAFMTEWNRNRAIYATFIRHAELDIANQSAAKIKAYLDGDEKSNFFAECDTLKMQIRHIAETERFSLDNIL
jgi:hypothetical protein